MKQLYIFFWCLFISQIGFSQCIGTQGEVRWRLWNDIIPITHELEDFTRTDRFPNGPDYVRTLNTIATPTNYTDNYGSQIKGYIRTGTTGAVQFSLTGDDFVSFYMQLPSNPDTLTLIQADSTETPEILTLDGNTYYYFEINHMEIGWEDHVTLQWKADFLSGGINSNTWLTVGGDYIYDTCDNAICPPSGTTCDDGNPNTTNDQEDGNCNCRGDLATTNTCVGERGILRVFKYEGLPGGEISVLNTAITNTKADKIEVLEENYQELYIASQGDPLEYGSYIRAYIKVPISGTYFFNITGSDENAFYLSSDDTPANKTANQAWTYWWSGVYVHNKYYGDDKPFDQTIDGIYLDANQYYYTELRHKGSENDWRNFGLFWKAPYQTRGDWARVPLHFFYDYTCNDPCVKAGVACNDGDPYTKNDVWDANCNCMGIPCTGPGDCDDPTTSYAPYEECETTNLLDNRADDAWLSCAPISDAPNSERNGQHWIQYDFGGLYNLGTSQVWNYNAAGATAAGFEQVAIDYSTDGINWTELGTYFWDLADGSNTYKGFNGPDFADITAQYVLISSLDNPNSCRGLSKVAFTAISCPTIQFTSPSIDQSIIQGTVINVAINTTGGEATVNSVTLYIDGNIIGTDNSAPYAWTNHASLQNLSVGDYQLTAETTDANGTKCQMSTIIHIISDDEIECQDIPLNLSTTDADFYRTTKTITSNATINAPDNVEYMAAQSITLMNGFTVEAGAAFIAKIGTCTNSSLLEPSNSRLTTITNTISEQTAIMLYPNPVQSNFTIEIDAPIAAQLDIRIYDVLGKEISFLSQNKPIEAGLQQIQLSAERLATGLYYCKIKVGEAEFTETFIRMDKN